MQVPKSPFDEIMIDQDEWEISRHWPKPGDPPASLEYLHDVHIDGAFVRSSTDTTTGANY